VTTAGELARLVREGALSPVEVVEHHLGRVRADINAVVQVDAERALAAARAGVQGPLAGVPFTVKDNIEAAEIEMAIGAPERVGVVPAGDATVVARMRAAGAILIGKTNCPPWGGGIETDNAVYGRTNNPYDVARTPGGSSGGEAAAIASGASMCGLGTDSGASARLPAHFCGLAALKPTAGRVPVTGVIDDEGQIGALGDPRTQVSPIARSVEDVARLLAVVAGPDGRDAGVPPMPIGDVGEVRGLRVATYVENEYVTPTAETVATVQRAGEALRAAGAVVDEGVSHPRGGHELTLEIWRSYGGEMAALDFYRVLRRWDAYRSDMLAFMERYDAILCPVFGGPAPRHGKIKRPGEIDPTSYTTPYSLTGWPAVTVRCGTSPEGLPIGVQVVARPWRDDVALAAARQLERDLGGWQPPAD
jgi:amidase